MTTLSITEHMTFDLETQLKLDRLWTAWAIHDKDGDYLNDSWNARNDSMWAEYQAALDAAHRAHCEAEAAQIVARHGDSIRQQIGQIGYWMLSQRLTAVQAVQNV